MRCIDNNMMRLHHDELVIWGYPMTRQNDDKCQNDDDGGGRSGFERFSGFAWFHLQFVQMMGASLLKTHRRFRQIHLAIWTNTFWYLNKYILVDFTCNLSKWWGTSLLKTQTRKCLSKSVAIWYSCTHHCTCIWYAIFPNDGGHHFSKPIDGPAMTISLV